MWRAQFSLFLFSLIALWFRSFIQTLIWTCNFYWENHIYFVHKTEFSDYSIAYIATYIYSSIYTAFSQTAKKLPKNVNIKGVFAANELDLDEVSIYGFDYDYT